MPTPNEIRRTAAYLRRAMVEHDSDDAADQIAYAMLLGAVEAMQWANGEPSLVDADESIMERIEAACANSASEQN